MSRAVGLTHLPSRVDPLPSEPYTNYVPELRAPQLLCHPSALFKPAQSVGSLRIGPHLNDATGHTLVLHGQRTGAMGPDLLALALPSRASLGSLPGSRVPPEQLWPVLTCPAYSSAFV